MEDISGFPDGIAFALDGWPQLNEATSLAQLDSSNSSPDTFIQDTMDRETGLFPIQSLQAPMRSEKIIQIPERSSQPIEGSGISFAEGYNIDLASDGTSFPSQSPSQGTQRIVVEQGQNHCQICRKTFKYGSTAVRSHIIDIHLQKEKRDLYVEPGNVGRPKRKATSDQAARLRKKRKSIAERTPSSSSFQHSLFLNPANAQLADFRRLQAELVVVLQDHRQLLGGLQQIHNRLMQSTDLLARLQTLHVRIRAAETFPMWLMADCWEKLMTSAIAFRGFARLSGIRVIYSEYILDSKELYQVMHIMVRKIPIMIRIAFHAPFDTMLLFLDNQFTSFGNAYLQSKRRVISAWFNHLPLR